MPLPKGPWDDLRKQIEEILDLPRGSTDPDWKLPTPAEATKRLIKDIEDFLRRKK